jgi:predicted short-subunit dehydrogenase-like oxidoreductase (DUF2520 family)
MRELERPSDTSPTRNPDLAPEIVRLPAIAVVGRGRVGTALTRALRERGLHPAGPFGRGADPSGFDAVLLCVPDAEIAAAAARISPGPLVGHCSGASGLGPLAPHERFSLHPLMTITAADGADRFAGAGAAIAGSTPRALDLARRLAAALEMPPFEVADSERAAYHAAASIASNFLVTLEAAAERLALDAGADREVLVPLVRATVENWAKLGAHGALTGPVARGDEPTVAAQRAAVCDRAPDLVPVFDALVEATRELAASRESVTAPKPTALTAREVART